MATRADDVVREDLLRRLPVARSDHRLAILAAPGGWGKTTMLGIWEDWANDTQFRRYSLTSSDNDTTRFINRLVDTGDSLPGEPSLPDPAESTPMVWVEQALPLFADALDASGPTAIVLDDYHVIENPEIHGVVQSLVEGVGPETLVVLSTRVDPPLRLARLRAARAVAELRAEDLQFTVADTDRLLRQTFDLQLAPDQVKLLVDTTEGWPAAISLAAQSLQTVNDPEEFLTRFVSTDRLIVDYLAEELLDTLPSSHQAFVHDTSVVEMFVPELAAAVTDVGDGELAVGQIGEDLERRGLLSRHYEANRMWYRYHQLLRDVLYRRLEHETRQARHRAAAEWFLSNDQPRRAIEQLTAGGETKRAANLVTEHAGNYVLRGRYATVMTWIAGLADEPDVEPGVFLLGAQAGLYSGRLGLGQAWLTRAETDTTASVSEQLLALSLRATIAHADGRISDATSVADELVEFYEANRAAIDLETGELAECLLVASVAFSLTGQFERSERWLDHCISVAATGDNQAPAVTALGLKAMHIYLEGDIAASRSLTDRAFEIASGMGLPPTALHMISALMGRILTGTDTEVREAIEHQRDISEYIYSPYSIAYGHMCEANFWIGAGDDAAAGRALVVARDMLDEVKQPSLHAEKFHDLMGGRLDKTASSDGRPAGPAALTDREIQVLRAFSSNLTQREIGRELFLSFNTIKTYARSAYRKLGVASRAEAVQVCREAGLF